MYNSLVPRPLPPFLRNNEDIINVSELGRGYMYNTSKPVYNNQKTSVCVCVCVCVDVYMWMCVFLLPQASLTLYVKKINLFAWLESVHVSVYNTSGQTT